jgi:hypothetical protein
MTGKRRRGYRTIRVELAKSDLILYGSAKLTDAVEAITRDMNLYHGVRFAQIIEAVYVQGKKDGAREAFKVTEERFKDAMKAVPHKRPGRPRRD